MGYYSVIFILGDFFCVSVNVYSYIDSDGSPALHHKQLIQVTQCRLSAQCTRGVSGWL